MTDELEREVRAMLRQQADVMPDGYEAPAGLSKRVARRRTRRITLVGAGSALVAAVIAAGAIGASATKSNHPRVVTSIPTTAPQIPTTVPQTSPTTQTTPTTKPTTPPTATPTAVTSIGCPTNSAFAPFNVAAPNVGPRDVAHLDPAIAGRVRSYVGPRAGFATDPRALEPDIALGPDGWSCRVFRSNGGGAVMYLFPDRAQGSFGSSDAGWTTSASYGGPEVRVVTAALGHDPDASLACAVFAAEPLVEHWVASSIGASSIGATSCAMPAGRRVTRLAPGVDSFVDTDGTTGIGVMRVSATTPQLAGDYGIVTCRLTGSDASLCGAIISDYATRYPGSVPS